MGVVRLACEVAGIARSTAYLAREADEGFARAWADALEDGLDLLEAEARRRALASSDQLLIHLLKAHRPSVHADRLRQEVTGKDGGAIGLDVKTWAALEAETLGALCLLEERLRPRGERGPA